MTAVGFALPRLSRTERSVLRLMWGKENISQKRIIDASNLPQQTVSRILTSFVENDIVRVGMTMGDRRPGKPQRALHIVPETAYGLGIAILADTISLAITDMNGVPVLQEMHAHRSCTPQQAARWTKDRLERLALARPEIMSRVAGLGIAMTGSFVDRRHFNTPNSLESWANIDVLDWAASVTTLPVLVENDGTAAALAEARLGKGRDTGSFAYLYLAEGVGGGVILEGRAWRGAHGNAGEYAAGLHLPVYPYPNLDLLRRILARDGMEFPTVTDMVSAFDPDWSGNRVWVSSVKDSLSVIVSNAMGILDVDAVVLGGQIPEALVDLVRPHIAVFDQERRGVLRPRGSIFAAGVKENAAAIGASTLTVRAYLDL
ncbi:ROK family transcriptional regulator [Swaminathania salitolerans]|uniref:Transcriptional regulator n=1 Tax=Swaminathania salitolerans TaxID=182838 RepID=A0A511BLB2_9PROT|nr:ROK family transcriptional regulator [Swaminathania salitolerans]GBQ10026.1 ROK family protein [Swaminathania salitolerans LMG 21291]GEL01137.1 transcriptional regulator [Swaminathania salitolerans]